MKVSVKPHVAGERRVLYDVQWHSWALPLYVAIGTSFFPTATSGFDVGLWDVQRVLIVRVLCLTMKVVLVGPLFAPEEDDE